MGKREYPAARTQGAATRSRTDEMRIVFETVSLSTDSLFQRAVSILHTAYLDSASGLGFQYNQVTLVKNDIFLNEYKAFHQEKKANNYTQEELQETYGFLLFETENQAKLVCQQGLCVGSSAITTLGDPAKGVYISKFSDYLHARPWYHGKSGYVVVFKLIKGKVKFVSENYTVNYTSPSSGYDCHVATNTNKVSHKTSHFRTFELSQYYLYEFADSTVTQRPRQICPYLIVAFQYREPKKMATPARQSLLELNENVLTTPWKGKLTIQGCLLCDVTLWSSCGGVIPDQLPHELDFKYVMKVSSLKKRLPEAAFRKQNDSKQKVFCQDMCFSMYEVELSNKQGGRIDKLTEYIKNKQLAIIKCLEHRGFFILLAPSALVSESSFGEGQMELCGLHLFHSPLSAGLNDLKVEDEISLKVISILPALNCALLEAKKSLTDEGMSPNTLVKQNFQELHKVDRSTSSTTSSQDGIKETAFCDKLSSDFDLIPPAEKCPSQSLTQLRSYLSNPNGYVLEVSATLEVLAECPQSPCISDGICDAGFSLVMTPDSEFLDGETDVRKETETENLGETCKAKQEAAVSLSKATNLRVQPKRKASMPPEMQSKKVNLCHPFPKKSPVVENKTLETATTLKLIKGQFPQKRKRGAEVLTAQVVQTTKMDRKNQEAPVYKDVPVTPSAKKTKKQEKSSVRTAPKTKPHVKKPPHSKVKHSQTYRIRKQPQPAKGETASPLQSEAASDGQADVTVTAVQPENNTVTQKDLPENSIVNCDSLNMLADLALSSATSSSSDPRNCPCPSELPQNVSLSKELCLRTSDHVYHKGAKSLKGGLSPKLSPGKKSNLTSDSIVNLEEDSVVSVDTQPSLPEETVETSDTRQNSFVAVEHSYALLLAEHSKKHLQRGVPSPAFVKNNTKGPEAGTPVGKVMPFRHQLITSPLQKFSEDSALKHKSRLASSILNDCHSSHTVLSCDGSLKVTFQCEAEYLFSLDSKYTNNPLEKTVIRALHGPWNTDLPDSVDEVKLLLHMWVALFYSNQSNIIRSPRRVVEHSNPAKYVSINSTLESVEFSEIDDPPSVERCSADPLLEASVTPTDCTAEVSFADPNTVIPLIKPQPARGLDLWIQDEQEEMFAKENHSDAPESQTFIYSCNSEIIGGIAEESADKLETSSLLLSSIGSPQTSIPGEDRAFKPLDNTRVTSFNDTVRQTTATKTYDCASSQTVTFQQSLYNTFENKVDIFHAVKQTNTGALQDLIQNSSPVYRDLEKADTTGYVMINLEPATLTYVPVQTEVVNRADQPTNLCLELTKVPPSASLRHSIPSLEKTQTQVLRNISSLLGPGESTKYLCTSSASEEIIAQEVGSLQKETPILDSALSSDNSVVAEMLPLVKSYKQSVSTQEMKISQELFLQNQSVRSLPSGEVKEPAQTEEVVSSPTSATLQKNHSLNRISSTTNTPKDSSQLKEDRCGLISESANLESFHLAFSKQSSPSVSTEEVNLELSEDSDIDKILTITPSNSPREETPSGKREQHQETSLTDVELEVVAKETAESKKTAFRDNREVNSANCLSVCPAMSVEPLENKEKRGSDSPTGTAVLPKESCAIEFGEEVNITSHFPFSSLIEEVSPPSSPDPQPPTEETHPPQCLSALNLSNILCEKSDRSSQSESVGLTITEEENPFTDPKHLVGQDTLMLAAQTQMSAQLSLGLSDHPGGKVTCLTPSGKITAEIVPSQCGEGFSSSEEIPCHNKDLNQPGLADNSRNDCGPSLEKLIASGNAPQPICVENSIPDFSHPISEAAELPFSPRKIKVNKNLTDKFLHTAAPVDRLNASLKQQTRRESTRKSLFRDLKTCEDNYLQVNSINSHSVDGLAFTRAHTYLESSKRTSTSVGPPHSRCPRPISGEREFQTQEISVVRMANLLKNSETETELREQNRDLGSIGCQSNSTPPGGEQETRHVPQGLPACATKDLRRGLFPMYASPYQKIAGFTESISIEPSAPFAPRSCDALIRRVSEEQEENKSPGEGLMFEDDSRALAEDSVISINSDLHHEPLSEDSDKDSFGDCRSPKFEVEDSCSLRHRYTKQEDALKDDYDCFLHLNTSDHEDWDYSHQTPGLETTIPPRNRYLDLKKEEMFRPSYIQIRDLHGFPRTYPNFTITKELQDTTRTLHSLGRQPGHTAYYSMLSSWTNSWQVVDDLTQSTLDLEYLRFAHNLKQMVKGGNSKHSAFSTKIFPKESPFHVTANAFSLTKRPESRLLRPVSRSRSPLLVTVMHSDTRQQNRHTRDLRSSSPDSHSFWKEKGGHSRNHFLSSDRNQMVPLHLNKLKYNSTSKDSRNDISLILNEYAEFNKVVLNSSPVVFQEKGSNVASGGVAPQEMCSSFLRKSTSYEDMITDLCTSLHVKLKNVMKEACKSTFLFYLVETEDKSFLVRTKNILRKSGHMEIEPQHFCQAFQREKEMLIIIIRNEDISSHVHQIPSLLKLKHFPNVIFAGVDSPEDVLDYSYQELFRTGGFVVSDDKVLETLTLVQLKEIIKILEKLNENGRWKWLLHYRESKKLKEGGRVDMTTRKKSVMLKSCQSASVVELLHYHQCDSRAATKSESLKCLLNLQIQHIHARFAVFLTDKPVISREVFENSGILITDIKDFTENIQKVAAPFRSSYW